MKQQRAKEVSHYERQSAEKFNNNNKSRTGLPRISDWNYQIKNTGIIFKDK